MTTAIRYRVIGMDCAKDAAEIESAARGVARVDAVKVSTATQTMTLQAVHSEQLLGQVEQAVGQLGYHLQRMAGPAAGPGRTADKVRAVDRDELPNVADHVTAAYRRTLWIVVLLNVSDGVVEMVGGFLSGSQALKADALDFLGDGLITFLGLLPIGWSLQWRVRAALIQGLFLGALGLGVLGTTAYRVLARQQPEAELMGLLGVFALVVNVTAALFLIPHRTGDANARAVWLFARNDAVGNVAVVIAALFLQSSRSIVRDARSDLRDVTPATSPH